MGQGRFAAPDALHSRSAIEPRTITINPEDSQGCQKQSAHLYYSLCWSCSAHPLSSPPAAVKLRSTSLQLKSAHPPCASWTAFSQCTGTSGGRLLLEIARLDTEFLYLGRCRRHRLERHRARSRAAGRGKACRSSASGPRCCWCRVIVVPRVVRQSGGTSRRRESFAQSCCGGSRLPGRDERPRAGRRDGLPGPRCRGRRQRALGRRRLPRRQNP